MQVIYFKTVNV